jgi:hypothetical protein
MELPDDAAARQQRGYDRQTVRHLSYPEVLLETGWIDYGPGVSCTATSSARRAP